MTPLSSRMFDVDDLDDRRRLVLEAAARVLAEDGPHGLSLRRISADAGGSTQLVYTLFGGKPGLADALYSEGFRRLGQAMKKGLASAPPPGHPDRIMAIGWAYVAFAKEEPAFFSVMFGRSIPGFTPARGTKALGRECTYGQLVAEVRACLEAGTLVAETPDQLARLCWLTVHGLASLEGAGMLVPDDEFVEHVLRTPLLAHQPGSA